MRKPTERELKKREAAGEASKASAGGIDGVSKTKHQVEATREGVEEEKWNEREEKRRERSEREDEMDAGWMRRGQRDRSRQKAGSWGN